MFVLLFLIIPVIFADPNCLLEDPLTDRCLNSIEMDQLVQQETSVYLCIIAHERKLYAKAEQFCRVAAEIETNSGYRLFEDFAQNAKWLKSFKQQYYLFFKDPFKHQQKANQSLAEISKIAKEVQGPIAQASKFQKAIQAYYANNFTKSLTLLEQSLIEEEVSDEDQIYQHFLMIRIFEKEGKFYEALNYVIKAVRESKKQHPYLQHLQGNLEMHHIQFRKAIASFTKTNLMFQADSNFPNGFSFTSYNLGLCQQKIGDLNSAITSYMTSHKLKNNVEALNAIGHAYFSKAIAAEGEERKKNLAKSEEYYFRAIQQEPTYHLAHYNLGVYYLQIQKPQKALESFQKTLDIAPQFLSGKYGMIKAEYALNSEKKGQRISHLIDELMKQSGNEVGLAGILHSVGDYKRSLEVIKRSKNQKQAALIEWKGQNQFSLDQFENAIASFKQAIFLGSKTPSIYFNLGYCLQSSRNIEDAIQYYEISYKMQKREETLKRLQNLQNSNQL